MLRIFRSTNYFSCVKAFSVRTEKLCPSSFTLIRKQNFCELRSIGDDVKNSEESNFTQNENSPSEAFLSSEKSNSGKKFQNIAQKIETTVDQKLSNNNDISSYNYFANLTNSLAELQTPSDNRKSSTKEYVEIEKRIPVSEEIDDRIDSEVEHYTGRPLNIKPAIPQKSFNLAAYVNESETLQNFVKLGVDLSRVEKDVDIANVIIKMDFERDVKPYLTFLTDVGVSAEEIGNCITKNPDLLRQSLDDMRVRINYLESKKFTRESIVRIVTKAPGILSTTVKRLDANLGFLQQQFHLSGNEVRTVVTTFPKIAIWKSLSIQVMKLTFQDLGFSKEQQKDILLAEPKLYLSGKYAIEQRFKYLNEVVGFSHEEILVWPRILRTRVSIMKQRHNFLKLVGRDQYDPKKENFVSLKKLVLGRDAEFCDLVAKVPVSQYNQYLKSV